MQKLIFLIIIFICLFGTTVLAQETELPNPGLTPDSPLYFLDTLGEKIVIFFTFGAEKKAEKASKIAEEKLAEAAAGQTFIGEAPVVIVAVALFPEDVMSCGVPAYSVDVAIAVDHMTLQAVEEGLGTCWIGAFSQEEVKEILNIPPQYKVVVLLPLGFPADVPSSKQRKSLEEIISGKNLK